MNGVLILRSWEKGEHKLRPHLDVLLETMWKHYPRIEVAVWSSMMEHNLLPLVEAAFGDRVEELAFIWDQQWCTQKTVSGMTKPLLRKDLKWLKGTQWAEYLPDRVLLIDDDPIKCAKNPPGTAIHPATFDGSPDDVLLDMSNYLDEFVASGHVSVSDFVLKKPFETFTAKSASDRDYWAVVKDEPVNVVEVYQPDLDAWLPQSAKRIEELPDGTVRIHADGGSIVEAAWDHVRDLQSDPKDVEDLPQHKIARSVDGHQAGRSFKSPDAEVKLPAPWQRIESKSRSGLFYFYNAITGESRTGPP
jgi:hypothetical protein